MVEAAAVTAALNSTSYPSSVMALISIVPRPTASETADPVIPAKIMAARMFTCPSPPRTWPTRALQNRKILSVSPVALAKRPARRKKGMASRGKEFTPYTMRWAIIP